VSELAVMLALFPGHVSYTMNERNIEESRPCVPCNVAEPLPSQCQLFTAMNLL